MKTRYPEIDLLRGLAMVAMILIHTTVFYVSNPVAFFLWNYSQWAVPAFIYCSGYIYFLKNNVNYFSKKRFLRLLIPYWIFLPFFFLVLLITYPKQLTIHYIFQSIFLTGGVQINWMVLLFLQFAVLLPILNWMHKQKTLFWIYSLLAIGSSILFLFWKFPFDWRIIMWLPWSVVLLFSFFYIKKGKKNVILIILIFSLIFYLFSLFILHSKGHSTHFYDNKYPPNLLIISFGMVAISGFYIILEKGRLPFSSILLFLSKNSYSVYFIHYLILTLFMPWVDKLRNVWFLLFFLVFIPTVLVQKLINKITGFNSPKKKNTQK